MFSKFSLVVRVACAIAALGISIDAATVKQVRAQHRRDGSYDAVAYTYLTELSDAANGGLGSRVTNTDEEVAAAAYLTTTLEGLGYNVTADDFTYNKTTGNVTETMASTNLILDIAGIKPEIVLLVAHYDTTGKDKGSEGATDNGAGTAGLLALAEALKTVENIPYSIRMLWTGAEENGLNGALDYVSKGLKNGALDDVKAAINFDTVGGGDFLYVHSAHQEYSEYEKKCNQLGLTNETYTYDPIVRDQLLKASAESEGIAHVFEIHPDFPGYPMGETGAWSDHSPFACAGIPIGYVETTNFNIDGEDHYDGYSQTINPMMWDCFNETTVSACNRTSETKWGKIWHTQFDRLDVLEEAFPGRIQEQLGDTVDSVLTFLTDGVFMDTIVASESSAAISADNAINEAENTATSTQGSYDNVAYGYLTALSDEANGGLGARVTNTDQEVAAKEFLVSTLADLGYTATTIDFTYNKTSGNETTTMASTNVILDIPGVNPEIVLLVAHYDTTGADKGSEGATDNGAGSAGLLTLAQAMKETATIPYTIRLLWTGAEENGLNGALDYVATGLTNGDLDNVKAVINFDTVGGGDLLYVHSAHEDYSEYEKKCDQLGLTNETYTYNPIVRDQMLKASAATEGIEHIFSLHPDFPGYPLGQTGAWSDHSPFACAGIPIGYVETTNFNIDGEDHFDGYSQTVNPMMWDCFNETTMGACNRTSETKWGKIWHTEFDRLDVLEEAFPGRVQEQLGDTVDSVITFLTGEEFMKAIVADAANNAVVTPPVVEAESDSAAATDVIDSEAPEETADVEVGSDVDDESADTSVDSEVPEETAEVVVDSEVPEETAEIVADSEVPEETADVVADSEAPEESADVVDSEGPADTASVAVTESAAASEAAVDSDVPADADADASTGESEEAEADAEESSGGLSTGAIIGIVAAVLFVGATGAFFVLRMKRRKNFTAESTTEL